MCRARRANRQPHLAHRAREADEPDAYYAGVQPAALFKSTDGGSISLTAGARSRRAGLLFDQGQATRAEWMPGFGGLCLHSIALDLVQANRQPNRMWTGISAAGVFRTADGGEKWKPTNRGVRADFNPADPLPEWGQCPQKLLPQPARPGLLYQQNHCGVYRTGNYGDEWTDITEGLPSRFGFVVGLHPREPDTLFVLPEDEALGTDVGGGIRYISGARFRVFRSRTGGQDWEPLTNGLPQQHAYVLVLREGMATDSLDPVGVYVGTVNGQIFYSRDEGDHRELMIENLPPINSVEVAVAV